MKTKIVYISGAEVFDIHDVRDAFDTVRTTLGLDKDTVLFGVPVDTDDTFATTVDTPVAHEIDVVEDKIEIEPESDISTDIPEPEPIPEPAPAKPIKKKTSSAKKKEVVAKEEPEDKPQDVIPILSVLGGKDTETAQIDSVMDDNADIVSIEQDVEPIINIPETDVIDAEPEFVTEPENEFYDTDIKNDIPTVETETATVDESDDDQLEKLLQSVQSLNEDSEEKPTELHIVENTFDETDATLEKLATEFAENQDKIVNTTKTAVRGGRIGKLKNILPFKKSKHNDSSLMGDLFGWAGVAANDDEIAIPEFFPTVDKNKNI